jgi:hypothetical protein
MYLLQTDQHRRGRRSDWRGAARATFEPGDEVVGEWSRDALMRMDARFVHAVERAIARGKEHAPKERPRP